MVPSWILGIAKLSPLLLIMSVGLILFGAARLYNYYQKRKQDIMEEEQKRQEFLRKMKFTPKKSS